MLRRLFQSLRLIDHPSEQYKEGLPEILADKLNIIKDVGQNDAVPDCFDAVLIIDAQESFCSVVKDIGTPASHVAADYIGELAPQLRGAGLPICSIYTNEVPLNAQDVDFMGYQYDPSDMLIRKTADSAFLGEGDDLDARLSDHGHKRLLVMGFNTSSCVHATVSKAIDLGYEVWICPDAVANNSVQSFGTWKTNDGNDALKDLYEKGARFMPSKQALEIAQKNAAPAMTTAPHLCP